jgi:hypothetical protein
MRNKKHKKKACLIAYQKYIFVRTCQIEVTTHYIKPLYKIVTLHNALYVSL